MMKHRLSVFIAASALWSAGGASADTDRAAPVLVELFTSQSCSSCPPAEALFREIARRGDVVALEWHVDYWDDLNAGASGRWKDPFSSRSHTARQRQYNVQLRGTASVYTPQAVIGGRLETVGSDPRKVDALIRRAQAEPAGARISVEQNGFRIDAAPAGVSAMLVTFRKTAMTRVKGGENADKALAEANVVVKAERLGDVRPGGTIAAPRLGAEIGCALILSDMKTGAVLAAKYCQT